jgi:hypothetical protein
MKLSVQAKYPFISNLIPFPPSTTRLKVSAFTHNVNWKKVV